MSTHEPEEIFCKNLHKSICNIYNNSISIIIPRHVERSNEIRDLFEKDGFKTHVHSSKKKINKKTQIYIVDTFGETKNFLKFCKITFIGGTFINHGGQNPLEAARLGCSIIHGKSIYNFTEVFNLLNKMNISHKVTNIKNAGKLIRSAHNKDRNTNKKLKKIVKLGEKILVNNKIEIEKLLNENKKTNILG